MARNVDSETFGQILERLPSEPLFWIFITPVVILAYRSPEIIRACGEVWRLGKKNKVEVEHKKQLLKKRLDTEKVRRLRNTKGGTK